MFKTQNKSEIIYLCSISAGGWIYKFPSILDVLKFLAANDHKLWFEDKNKNQYLEDINMGKDMKIYHDVHYYRNKETGEWETQEKDILVLRDYMFIDGFGRHIDFRIYKKEIQILKNSGNIDYNVIKAPRRKRRKKIYYPEKPNFRNGPVPYTGNSYHRKWYRHVKTTNEKRQNSDPEIYEYIRPSRRPDALPSLYDDIPRRYSKSWKDCTKKRKQWMK
jgi:hypothetical protein